MTKLYGNNGLKAKGDYSELSSIRDFVQLKARTAGLEEDKINKITLAVDEACSNLIHYSMKFDAKENIVIECSKEKDCFTVLIADSGIPFDPNSNPSPNMGEYFEKYKSGGLGIYIIKEIVDRIKYLPSENEQSSNKLFLTICRK